MNSLIQKAKSVLTISILICATSALYAQVQPDNTAVNQRDRNASEPTADQQKMNAADQQLSASIRKQIMEDKSLSTDAHNVKIISQNGEVTLKGPVKSEDERRSILDKAKANTGDDKKVHDEISVKQ
jgi:hyperosmotically inducible periplasmic protein